MKRTDIHRPSSPAFDPEAYEMFGIYELVMKVRIIDGYTVIPGSPFPIVITRSHVEDSQFKLDLLSLEAKGWNTDVVGSRDSVRSKQCGHCGAHLKYGALMTYAKETALIVVGEECLDNRFQSGLTKQEFQTLREAGRLNRERATKAEQVTAFYAANPDLVNARESENSFVKDVMGKLEQDGELTERQVEAVKKAVRIDAERAANKIKWAAEAKLAADAPSGRVTVTGEIVSTKYQESAYGSTLKMIVKTDDGWKLWVTLPDSIYRDIKGSGFQTNSNAKLEGNRVELTVTVTPSDRDPKFAFGKRPSKGRVVA
jgi:hypothetical protein